MFWIGTLLLGLFWGGSYLAIRFVVEDAPPYAGATARLLIALACVSPLLLLERPRSAWKWRGWAVLVGVLNLGIPWAILFWAERFIPPSLGALSACAVPIFTRLFSPWINPSDSHPRGEWLGIGVGLLGVVLLVMPSWQAPDPTQMAAGLILLVMALGYAAGILGTRRFSPYLNATENLCYQVIGGILFLAPLAFAFEPVHPFAWGFKTWLALLYLGFFSTFLAFLIFFWIVKQYGSTQAAVAPYFPPFVSLLLDRLILNTLPEPLSIVGGGVILLGVYLTQRYRKTG